jgi:hypothetical protein
MILLFLSSLLRGEVREEGGINEAMESDKGT